MSDEKNNLFSDVEDVETYVCEKRKGRLDKSALAGLDVFFNAVGQHEAGYGKNEVLENFMYLMDSWGADKGEARILAASKNFELLFKIHRILQDLYPQQSEEVKGWVRCRNRDLGDAVPFEIMLEEKETGIERVYKYLRMLLFV